MEIRCSSRVLHKITTKHNVTLEEVQECFASRSGVDLVDQRAEHQTNPPSRWFVSETDRGRKLKVVFMFIDGEIHLKTAYEPSEDVKALYKRLSR